MSKQLMEFGRSLLSLLQDGFSFSFGVPEIVHDLQNLKTLQTTPPKFNIDMYMQLMVPCKGLGRLSQKNTISVMSMLPA